MSKIKDKIKEKVGAVDNISKFKKFSKLKASYIEYDKFADSNLHEGYFCYNCIYWINASGGKCMLVEDNGPDVLGKVSDVIAPTDAAQAMNPIITSYMTQEAQLKQRAWIPKRIRKKLRLQM